MDFGLRLETQQKLVMTQELRQAIAILQLSTQELAAAVEQQFLENPMLELDETKRENGRDAEAVDDKQYTAEEFRELDAYLNRGNIRNTVSGQAVEKPSFELFAAQQTSLHEQLEFQLDVTVTHTPHNAIGRYLIGCIDSNGYLRCTIEEAAVALAVPETVVAEVLTIIQTFDPEGVGARDLQECLRIQATQKGLYNQLVAVLIDAYLPDVAAGKYKVIAEKLKCTPYDVQTAVDVIRRLNPKPGLAFGGDVAGYIVPDVTVEKINDDYVILINDNDIPRLMINPAYRNAVDKPDQETKKFVETRLNAAIWLIKSIEHRRNTLYRVTEALIELQRDFFDKGTSYIRPLIMKTVADKLAIHESTVSRTVANKYIQTAHGLLSMRKFFASGIQTAVNGEEMISDNIKQQIKKLIAEENATRPLSDQAISDVLAKQDIHISRRTVTKYREELGIASSGKRKRY